MSQTLKTQCCIAGGGPAGILLGYLLARAGVEVIVLEKHADFFRDFRGDTIHPSTLELIHELGIMEDFQRIHQQHMPYLSVLIDDERIKVVDFSHLPVHYRYIALMPQWDFLSFLAEQGGKYPTFHLLKNAEATDLIREDGTVKGVRIKTPGGETEVRATLTIGADGRSSDVRRLAGMKVTETGVPIDVLWLRIPKNEAVPEYTLGYFKAGKTMVLIDRDDYYQCGYIIPKGKYEEIQQHGIEAFRQDILSLAPFLNDQVQGINWTDISLLTVKIDHLDTWYMDGLLCIGDAAHAMSPAGGVGINLAIQDAVATANILSDALKSGTVTTSLLRKVQDRRMMPARMIQRMQEFIHNNFINAARPISTNSKGTKIFIWVVRHFTFLRRIPARLVGMGFRPEHIR